MATNRMRSVGPHSDAIGSTEERTFAGAETVGSERSPGADGTGNVLDTLSREQASAAIAARKRAVLRQAGVRLGAWGAFPFLLRRSYDALVQSAGETGKLDVRATLEAWSTFVNTQRGRGKAVEARSLKARFSEHVAEDGPIWYGDRPDGADGLRVEVAVVTPEKRGKQDAPGSYGLQARVTRGGRLLRVERADGPDVLAAIIDAARSEQEAFEREVAIVRKAVGDFELMGATKKAAQLRAFVKRRWGITIEPLVSLALVVTLFLAGCAGAVYGGYKLVTYVIRMSPSYAPTRSGPGPAPHAGAPAWVDNPGVGAVWPQRVETVQLATGRATIVVSFQSRRQVGYHVVAAPFVCAKHGVEAPVWDWLIREYKYPKGDMRNLEDNGTAVLTRDAWVLHTFSQPLADPSRQSVAVMQRCSETTKTAWQYFPRANAGDTYSIDPKDKSVTLTTTDPTWRNRLPATTTVEAVEEKTSTDKH